MANSLQDLPNIAKASFLDPNGFLVSFQAVFIKLHIFLLEAWHYE